MRPGGFLISLWGHNHRTRGWMAHQLRRWYDPRSTNSWISLLSAPPFFSLSADCFVNEGRKKMFFLAECYHNKKLISTNCSKITQKLSPCSSLCQWWAVLFQYNFCLCLGFSCSPCNLGPLVVRGASQSGFSWLLTSNCLGKRNNGSKVCVLKSV